MTVLVRKDSWHSSPDWIIIPIYRWRENGHQIAAPRIRDALDISKKTERSTCDKTKATRPVSRWWMEIFETVGRIVEKRYGAIPFLILSAVWWNIHASISMSIKRIASVSKLRQRCWIDRRLYWIMKENGCWHRVIKIDGGFFLSPQYEPGCATVLSFQYPSPPSGRTLYIGRRVGRKCIDDAKKKKFHHAQVTQGKKETRQIGSAVVFN